MQTIYMSENVPVCNDNICKCNVYFKYIQIYREGRDSLCTNHTYAKNLYFLKIYTDIEK